MLVRSGWNSHYALNENSEVFLEVFWSDFVTSVLSAHFVLSDLCRVMITIKYDCCKGYRVFFFFAQLEDCYQSIFCEESRRGWAGIGSRGQIYFRKCITVNKRAVA